MRPSTKPKFLVSQDVIPQVTLNDTALFNPATVEGPQTSALLKAEASTFVLYESKPPAEDQRQFAEFLLRLASELSFDSGGLTFGQHMVFPTIDITGQTSFNSQDAKPHTELLKKHLPNLGMVTLGISETLAVRRNNKKYTALSIDFNALRRGQYPFFMSALPSNKERVSGVLTNLLKYIKETAEELGLHEPQFEAAYPSLQAVLGPPRRQRGTVSDGIFNIWSAKGTLNPSKQLHMHTFRCNARRTSLWHRAFAAGSGDDALKLVARNIDLDYSSALEAAVNAIEPKSQDVYPGAFFLRSPFDRLTSVDSYSNVAPSVPLYMADLSMMPSISATLSSSRNTSSLFSSEKYGPSEEESGSRRFARSEILYRFTPESSDAPDTEYSSDKNPDINDDFFREPPVACPYDAEEAQRLMYKGLDSNITAAPETPSDEKGVQDSSSEEEEEEEVLFVDPFLSPDVEDEEEFSDFDYLSDTESEDDIQPFLLDFIERGSQSSSGLLFSGDQWTFDSEDDSYDSDDDDDDDDDDTEGSYWFTSDEAIGDPTQREALSEEISSGMELLVSHPSASEQYRRRAEAISAAHMVLHNDDLCNTKNEKFLNVLRMGAMATAAQMDFVKSERTRKKRRKRTRSRPPRRRRKKKKRKSKTGTRDGTATKGAKKPNGDSTGIKKSTQKEKDQPAKTPTKGKSAAAPGRQKQPVTGNGGTQRPRKTKPLPTPPVKTTPARPKKPLPRKPVAPAAPARPKSKAPEKPPPSAPSRQTGKTGTKTTPTKPANQGEKGVKPPTTKGKESTTTDKKPATAGKESATTDKKPATAGKESATMDKKPATAGKESATTDKKPATADKEPAKKPSKTDKTEKSKTEKTEDDGTTKPSEDDEKKKKKRKTTKDTAKKKKGTETKEQRRKRRERQRKRRDKRRRREEKDRRRRERKEQNDQQETQRQQAQTGGGGGGGAGPVPFSPRGGPSSLPPPLAPISVGPGPLRGFDDDFDDDFDDFESDFGEEFEGQDTLDDFEDQSEELPDEREGERFPLEDDVPAEEQETIPPEPESRPREVPVEEEEEEEEEEDAFFEEGDDFEEEEFEDDAEFEEEIPTLVPSRVSEPEPQSEPEPPTPLPFAPLLREEEETASIALDEFQSRTPEQAVEELFGPIVEADRRGQEKRNGIFDYFKIF